MNFHARTDRLKNFLSFIWLNSCKFVKFVSSVLENLRVEE